MTEAAVEAALKELRRDEGNKRCFVCDERGPTYVDMDHSAFVCTTCAGIMREFTFKLKGISMATFTSAEVKALKQAGVNTGATKTWLARFRGGKPQPGDKDNIRAFIKETFVSKKHCEKAKKKAASSDDDDDEDEEDEKPSRLKKESSSSKSTSARKGSVGSVEEDKPKTRKGSISEDAKPKSSTTKMSVNIKPAQQQVQQLKPKPAAASSLLDLDFGAPAAPSNNNNNDGFDDFVSAASDPFAAAAAPSSTNNSSKPMQAAKAPSAADPFDFGDFSAAVPSAPAAPAASSDPFGSFSSAPPAVASQSTPLPMGGGGAGGTFHQQQTAMGGYSSHPPQQYTQQQPQQQMVGSYPVSPQVVGNGSGSSSFLGASSPGSYASPPQQQMSPQQEQVLAMMGTMMGNLPRQETIARIQQNPQLMEYFTQMVQAMPPSPQPQQPLAHQQMSWGGGGNAVMSGAHVAPAATFSTTAPPTGYVSSNPGKNPFIQAKLGNKAIVPMSGDIFGSFS